MQISPCQSQKIPAQCLPKPEAEAHVGLVLSSLTQGAAIHLLSTPIHKWSPQQVLISSCVATCLYCLVILCYCKHTAKMVFVYPFNVEKCWNKNLQKGRTVPQTCINFRHQSYHLLCSCELFFSYLSIYMVLQDLLLPEINFWASILY